MFHKVDGSEDDHTVLRIGDNDLLLAGDDEDDEDEGDAEEKQETF